MPAGALCITSGKERIIQTMKMRVVGGSLNVRTAPGLSADINHILADGEIIEVDNEKDGWYKFGSGYVMAKYLEEVKEEEPAPSEDLKAAAEEIKQAAEEIRKVAKEAKTTAKKTSKKKTADK